MVMPSIHRTILYRLLAAWVVISLLIGVAVSWLGVRKIDRELVSLATVEMKKFAMANSVLSKPPEAARSRPKPPEAVRSVLDLPASQAIREYFIVGEFQDRARRKLAAVINPLHAAMTPEVERQAAGLPLDHETLFRKFSADDRSWVRTRVRLNGAETAGAVYSRAHS
jgi:hypothetical protein